jgi:hypothetical protein
VTFVPLFVLLVVSVVMALAAQLVLRVVASRPRRGDGRDSSVDSIVLLVRVLLPSVIDAMPALIIIVFWPLQTWEARLLVGVIMVLTAIFVYRDATNRLRTARWLAILRLVKRRYGTGGSAGVRSGPGR